jgi:ketosteroid isomerase-like protein
MQEKDVITTIQKRSFCKSVGKGGSNMNEEEKSHILEILDMYVHAFETNDTDLMKRLHWVDDPRFTGIEDYIPEPFGRKTFCELINWIETNQGQGETMRFYNTNVYILTPDVAYAVTLQEISSPEDEAAQTSRVTFIFLKKMDQWKIIHGHSSPLLQYG